MRTLSFLYHDPDGQMTASTASWEILHLEPVLEELRIGTGQDFLNVILGYGALGRFLFIPEYESGFWVDDPTDTNFSVQHLENVMCSEKAAAVAYALRDYCMC